MSGARTLSVVYLLGASAFGFALALQAQQPWALGARQAAITAGPYAVTAARTVNQLAVAPALAWATQSTAQISAWVWPKSEAKAPIKIAKASPPKAPALRPAVIPPAAAPATPSPSVVAPTAAPKPSEMRLADTETDNSTLAPAPDATPPSPAEVGRVLAHLKVSLSKDLYENFSLFLYVSKADHGPWHQRMFVFAKQDNGNLNLMYSFPVSTGREVLMPNPNGTAMWHTNTPEGYFQIDPERVYKRYTSQQWGHKMPYAMFFNWEHDGLQTGVAIHSAVGDDVADVGKRASAGCIRLNPQNARLLFDLVKKNYRGQTPLFAYDRRTATMSKDGLLMHDKAGNLQYAEGYKVLVLIENNGGDDMVAALF